MIVCCIAENSTSMTIETNITLTLKAVLNMVIIIIKIIPATIAVSIINKTLLVPKYTSEAKVAAKAVLAPNAMFTLPVPKIKIAPVATVPVIIAWPTIILILLKLLNFPPVATEKNM